MQKRENFGSKFGVLMALAGSAIGLGNMWRFPYLTAENGGAAFILIYVLLLLTISLPTMVAEYVIGRRSRTNASTAFKKLGFPKLGVFGMFAILAALFVLSFYCVIGGWAVKYLNEACRLNFTSPDADYAGRFSVFVASTGRQIGYTFIFLGMTVFVVAGGVKKGIEKFSKIMMSILFVIIILTAIRSVTLPGAMEGIRYLLVPDFSRVTGETWAAALGQGFFSLGLGCGSILIYGSYVKVEENLVMTSIITAMMDTVFAIVAGIAIIPAIFAIASINGVAPDINAGPGLVFITLPSIFASMPLGSVVAILFFSSLLLAAITSSVSLMESLVTFFMEKCNTTRPVSVILAFLLCAALGTFCSLSNGILSDLRILGMNVFDFLDKTSANILMTASCLIMVIFVGWIMKKEDFLDELTGHGAVKSPTLLHYVEYYLIKFMAPIGIIAIILCNIIF